MTCFRYHGSLLLFLLFFLISCSTSNSSKKNQDFNSLQLSAQDHREIEAGEMIHREIITQFFPLPDKNLNDYIRSVGNQLTLYVKRQNLPYSYTLLEDERIYITSAPGGKIYLTSGMLAFLNNEAELAAILAHELAQEQFKLPNPRIKTAINNALTSIAMVGSMFLGPFGPLAVIGAQTVQTYSMYEKTKADRAAKADQMSLGYLVQANYDPQAAIDFFDRLVQLPPSGLAKIFNYNLSHPISLKRYEALQEAYASLDLSNAVLNIKEQEFHEALLTFRQYWQEQLKKSP